MVGQAQAEGEAGGLKVFISYSRQDVDFADDLELFLEMRGFDPIIDRHDIDHNDDWRARLYELIHGCDVVVFVLTETSGASPICAWEVAEAAKLGKRRLVVTPGPLPAGTQPPEGLSAANWIHCWRNPAAPDSSTANGKKELERALKTDVVWLRERTRLMEQAERWTGRETARGGESSLLLRGNVLAEALAWAGKTPKGENIPSRVTAFLAASEANDARVKAEAEAGLAEKEAALRKAAEASHRVRRASLIGAAVAAAFLVAAVVAGWFAVQMQDEARRQSAEAARRSSDVIAFQADALAQSTGAYETAMLMALYANPGAATDTNSDAYALARTTLVSTASNMQLVKMLRGHTTEVQSAVFSPDGKQVLTTSFDNKDNIRLWDAATGQTIAAYTTRNNYLLTAAFASDGVRYAFADYQSVHVLLAAESRSLATLVVPDTVDSLAMSANGSRVIATLRDKTARIWEVASGVEIGRLPEIPATLEQCALSADGSRAAVALEGGLVLVWDVRTNAVPKLLEGFKGSVKSLAFSTDGKRLIAAGSDVSPEMWVIDTDTKSRHLLTDETVFSAAAFSPDGAFAVIASPAGSIFVSDTETRDQLSMIRGHEDAVTSVRVSPDNQFILTASADGSVSIWTLRPAPVRTVFASGKFQPDFITYAPDGATILTGGFDADALWNATDGKLLGPLIDEKSDVRSGVFFPDGSHIATMSSDGEIRVWDTATRRVAWKMPKRSLSSSMALSRDGTRLVLATDDKSLEVVNALTGAEIARLPVNANDMDALAYSADGSLLVMSAGGGNITVLDATSGNVSLQFKWQAQPVEAVNFSPDGSRIITGGADNSVRIWDAATGAPIRRLDGHAAPVFIAKYSRDGALILSVSQDDYTRLWDARTGRLIRAMSGISTYADLSPDGKRLAATQFDQDAVVWDLPEIIHAPVRRQVEIACDKLRQANAPMAFSSADVARYSVLQDQPMDPANPGFLVSPCKGVLGAQTGAKPETP